MAVPMIEHPLAATAHNGKVLVEGEAGVAFTITPQAALETCEKLEASALRALGQVRMKQWIEDEIPPH